MTDLVSRSLLSRESLYRLSSSPQGMSMDQLIGLLEKLERSSSGLMTSPQRLAAALLKRFRYDGIIDQASGVAA